jgi:hypothetical protein
MDIYSSKFSSQMEFGKILFQRVEVTSKSCQICHTRPLCTV